MLFSKDDIQDALRSLTKELVQSDVEITIQVVGGAAVALQVEREAATGDIDAMFRRSSQIFDAIKRVGDERGWPDTWLNDAVNMYASHHDSADDWDIQTSESGVVILVARPELLLAMKLAAGRGRRDSTDIDLLLDACEISSIEEAAALFDRYYPADVIATKAMAQLKDRYATGSNLL
jgi:Nucleotidyltransferase of unknown function (DUF6036)